MGNGEVEVVEDDVSSGGVTGDGVDGGGDGERGREDGRRGDLGISESEGRERDDDKGGEEVVATGKGCDVWSGERLGGRWVDEDVVTDGSDDDNDDNVGVQWIERRSEGDASRRRSAACKGRL